MDDKDDVSRVESRQEYTQTNDYASQDIQKVAHRLDDTEFFLAQKRYLRKLDLTILPMISTLYFFEYLDRGNIAVCFSYLSSPSDLQSRTLTSVHRQNAKLYGYNKGHHTTASGMGPGEESLTATQWQLIIMIFYVGLVLFQVPGCIGYRVFPPSKVYLLSATDLRYRLVIDTQQWIAFGVCGWAITSLLQCTAFNLAGGLVCRVFIGVFEGLFGTGIVYYLSLWYHRTEMGVRVFWFLGPTALSG
jgi:MFS family permease